MYVNKNNANSSSKNVFDKHYTYYIYIERSIYISLSIYISIYQLLIQ